MKRRFVAALIVVLAVLFSQGGGHVLAAICPHLRAKQPENACHKNSAQAVAGHHQSEVVKSPAFEIEEPGMGCSHCVVHSGNKREEFVFQETNTSPRADDQKSASPVVNVEPPYFSKTFAWSVRTHGPPDPTAPLHILLNVFRI